MQGYPPPQGGGANYGQGYPPPAGGGAPGGYPPQQGGAPGGYPPVNAIGGGAPGGYPPQQQQQPGGYPPAGGMQGGYPPAGGGGVPGYPAPAGGAPGGYPGQPQQGGYPPAGGGYPQQGGAYGGAPAPGAYGAPGGSALADDEEFVITDEHGNETPISREEAMAAGGEGMPYQKEVSTSDRGLTTQDGDRGIGKVLLGAAAAGIAVYLIKGQIKKRKKRPQNQQQMYPGQHGFKPPGGHHGYPQGNPAPFRGAPGPGAPPQGNPAQYPHMYGGGAGGGEPQV